MDSKAMQKSAIRVKASDYIGIADVDNKQHYSILTTRSREVKCGLLILEAPRGILPKRRIKCPISSKLES